MMRHFINRSTLIGRRLGAGFFMIAMLAAMGLTGAQAQVDVSAGGSDTKGNGLDVTSTTLDFGVVRSEGSTSRILTLGITNVDPLRYQLPFERFFNTERADMPDIDMDFPDDRREEVIDYVTRKYGEDRVAQMVTFNTMAAKASVKDVVR